MSFFDKKLFSIFFVFYYMSLLKNTCVFLYVTLQYQCIFLSKKYQCIIIFSLCILQFII